MNDRMYELLAEVRNQPLDVVKKAPHGSALLTPTQLEKFAELIVRECLSYAKDGDLDFMKFMIKQHFGVEE